MNLLRKLLLYPAALLVMLILPISCASTPETTEEEPVAQTTAPVETPVDATSDTAAASRSDALNARKTAVDAKAPKAAPVLFEEGEGYVTAGDAKVSEQNYQGAVENFVKAKESFTAAAVKAEEEKEKAIAAMKAADEAIANTEKNAEDAEKSAAEEEE